MQMKVNLQHREHNMEAAALRFVMWFIIPAKLCCVRFHLGWVRLQWWRHPVPLSAPCFCIVVAACVQHHCLGKLTQQQCWFSRWRAALAENAELTTGQRAAKCKPSIHSVQQNPGLKLSQRHFLLLLLRIKPPLRPTWLWVFTNLTFSWADMAVRADRSAAEAGWLLLRSARRGREVSTLTPQSRMLTAVNDRLHTHRGLLSPG